MVLSQRPFMKNQQTVANAAQQIPVDCEDVAAWELSVNHHVYWVAASTNDDEEEMRIAKWTSLANHIQGVHVHHGHSDMFPRCLHGDLNEAERKKKWLKPGNLTVCLAK